MQLKMVELMERKEGTTLLSEGLRKQEKIRRNG